MSDGARKVETELQDYLDGRLPAALRTEFEDRLERSPELRRALESALELRDALGAGDDVLPPGFYTRARARFEQAEARRRSRWSFRLLSWETAGVVAAAALTTALFVPRLMHEGVPEDLGAAGQLTLQDAVAPIETALPADDRDSSGIGLEQAGEPAVLDEAVGGLLEGQAEDARAASRPAEPERVRRRVVAKEKSEKTSPKDSGKLDENFATGDWSPDPGAGADLEAESGRRSPSPPPPAAPKKRAPQSRAKGESRGQEESKQRAAAPESGPETGSEQRDDSFYRAERENEALRSTASSATAEGLSRQSALTRVEADAAESFDDVRSATTSPISVELPAGLVAPGELRTVEETDEWAALLEGSDGQALSMLGPPARERRLVMIGARKDLACEALRVDRVGEEYRLDMNAARKGPGTVAGCAFTLPRDGRPVVVPGGGDPRTR